MAVLFFSKNLMKQAYKKWLISFGSLLSSDFICSYHFNDELQLQKSLSNFSH
jgi:hypothetical protein